MPRMAEPDGTAGRNVPLADDAARRESGRPACDVDDRMVCERCGKAEMYRMHAVWRCPACGFWERCD